MGDLIALSERGAEMEIIYVLLGVGVGVFEWAALTRGNDSRYGLTDPEWTRRRVWRGFRNTR